MDGRSSYKKAIRRLFSSTENYSHPLYQPTCKPGFIGGTAQNILFGVQAIIPGMKWNSCVLRTEPALQKLFSSLICLKEKSFNSHPRLIATTYPLWVMFRHRRWREIIFKRLVLSFEVKKKLKNGLLLA